MINKPKESIVTTQLQDRIPCPKCNSENVRICGQNMTKQYGLRRQYECKECKNRYTPPALQANENRPACPQCKEFMDKKGRRQGAQLWGCPKCGLMKREGKVLTIAQILKYYPHLREHMHRLEAQYKQAEEERMRRILHDQEEAAKEAMSAWIDKRRKAIEKQTQSKTLRALSIINGQVQIEEYDTKHKCITVEEVRWILKYVGRYTPYWMYFILRITTGMRPEEAVRLTLYDLSPDCGTITYRVDKPATRFNRNAEYVRKSKHRAITLDPWVRSQLIEYLNRTCRVLQIEGRTEYVSPYQGQRLFPWKDMMTVGAYWYKMRLKMQAAGFDSLRVVREHIREIKGTRDRTYVLRPHILRHFSASIMYYKLNKDIKAVMEWIKHNDVETTNGYVHSAEEMGTTPELLAKATWPELLDYDDAQLSLPVGEAPEQVSLKLWSG